jgi:hypothetical protein
MVKLDEHFHLFYTLMLKIIGLVDFIFIFLSVKDNSGVKAVQLCNGNCLTSHRFVIMISLTFKEK